MSRLKLLRSGVANVFRFIRNPKGSGKTSAKSIKSSGTPANVSLTRHVTEAEGIIPVSTKTLLSRVISKEQFLYPNERQQVASLASAVDTVLFRKSYSELEELKNCYDLIDPEKEIVDDQASSRKGALDKERELLQRISRVLDQGKFVEIPINSILGQYNTNRGIILTVNAADYEILRVWARGLNEGSKTPLPFYKKFYQYIWKPELQCFMHVVTAVRQISGDKLWLKVYRQTPKEELLGLLPAGVMRMNNVNQWLLKIAAISGALSAGIMMLYQSQYLWAVLFTSLLAGSGSVASYLHGRNRFLRRVGALQYHHCMANNWGAVTVAVNMAQQSVVKDVLLAYLFLLAPPNRPDDPKAVFSSKQPKYHTENSLKLVVEEWLDQNFNCSVRFNSEVAFKKLDELGLLVRRSDGTVSVLSMEDAMELLPKPPSPWEMKMPPQDDLIETELTQKWPTLMQWK